MTQHKYVKMARSRKNGIILFSNTLPFLCAEALVDENDKIVSRITQLVVGEDEFMNAFGILDKRKLFSIKETVIFDVFLVIVSLLVSLLLKNICVLLASVYFCFYMSVPFFTFIKLAYVMKSSKESKYSVAKFHSAEHMVINAYTDLQRIPSFDEVKKASRFSRHCGSMKLIEDLSFKMVFAILIACIGIPGLTILNYALLVLFVFILYILEIKNKWLKVLQVFITSTPSDTEIEVAIEAIKNFEQMENAFSGGSECIMINVVHDY